MPANTSNGYPYPLGTDRVMDGDDSIKSLAEAVNTKAAISASGTGTIPTPAALNTTSTVAVTLPAGRFTAVPVVTGSQNASNPMVTVFSISAVSASGFVAYGARISGGLNVIPFSWHARTEG